MIKVLIVDDSPSVRMMLERIFSADPDLEVVGTACDGEQAVVAVERLAPDVVTMDICMPRMNGLDATRRIMEIHPVPIVIVSGNLDEEEVLTSFRAMEAGALVAMPKPCANGHSAHESEVASLVQRVKLMAEVRVVKRWPRPGKGASRSLPFTAVARPQAAPRVVAIGASTGGPVVIKTILSSLPAEFSLPVLIVQHMAEGFIRGFVDWLALSSRLPVHVASNGVKLLPGHVYIAPYGYHMQAAAGDVVTLNREAPENGQRPAVAVLFRSVAEVYGGGAVGILLTGMGDDGALELKLLKDRGAVTIAQDQSSSVIYGMPGEAAKLVAAGYILPPEQIVAALTQMGAVN
jgi:two-component system chemotaxis response regulator CheB